MTQQPTASEQVSNLHKQLSAALLQKDVLNDQLTGLTDQIRALRNAIAGVDLGRKVQIELVAAQTPPEPTA